MNDSPRVLIIGANGFIGSHLVGMFAADGWMVEAYDRYSSPPRFTHKSVDIVQGGFEDADLAGRRINGQDLVLHALSATTPTTGPNDPPGDIASNLVPTVRILEACSRTAVKRFGFISSGGTIYGSVAGRARESDLLRPISPYGIGKVSIENYMRYYSDIKGLPSVSLRLANPYGLRSDGSLPEFGIIGTLIRSAFEERPIKMFGDGSMIRDYIHIADATRMMFDALKNAGLQGPINIGSGVGSKVSELICLANIISGTELTVEKMPVPADFVDRVVLDVGLFERHFGRLDLVPIEAHFTNMWNDWTGRQ